MILESIAIIAFMIFFAWFVFDVNIWGIIGFAATALFFGALGTFMGICMKFGWNLF
jgi:hypothetical protein